jgi:hypothetical protein
MYVLMRWSEGKTATFKMVVRQSPTRAERVVREVLGSFCGVLLTDGYKGRFAQSMQEIVHAKSWATLIPPSRSISLPHDCGNSTSPILRCAPISIAAVNKRDRWELYCFEGRVLGDREGPQESGILTRFASFQGRISWLHLSETNQSS